MAMNEELKQYLIDDAKSRGEDCDGVLTEPRVWYDIYDLAASTSTSAGPIVQSPNQDVFFNGEQFPIRMTRIAFAILGHTLTSGNVFTPVTADAYLQRVGFRFRQHGNYYMNRIPMPGPVWATQVVAQPESISPGVVAWELDKPLILSARDSLRVSVQLAVSVAPNTRPLNVTFHGYGILSKQPYMFSGSIDLSTTTETEINVSNYRNDGSEPVVITKMVCVGGAASNATDLTPDSRFFSINVQQVGNGTNAKWFVGPTNTTGTAYPNCPLPLLGGSGGRAVIHNIAGQGWVFKPGEGFSLDYQRLSSTVDATLASIRVGVAVLGYIAVK